MRILIQDFGFQYMIRIKAATNRILQGELPTSLTDLDERASELVANLLASGASGDFSEFVQRQLKADLQDTYYDPTVVLRLIARIRELESGSAPEEETR